MASCCCVVASFNSSHGLLNWLSIFIVLLYSRQYKKCLLPLFPMLFVIAFYLLKMRGMVHSNHNISDLPLMDIAGFFLTFITGNIWTSMDKYGWVIGIIVLCTLGALILFKRLWKNYLIIALAVLGLLIAAMVTFGRYGFGITYAYQPRYFQLQMPVYLSIVIALSCSSCNASMNKGGSVSVRAGKDFIKCILKKLSAYLLYLIILLVFITASVGGLKYSFWLNAAMVNHSEKLRNFNNLPRADFEHDVYTYEYIKNKYRFSERKNSMFSQTNETLVNHYKWVKHPNIKHVSVAYSCFSLNWS